MTSCITSFNFEKFHTNYKTDVLLERRLFAFALLKLRAMTQQAFDKDSILIVDQNGFRYHLFCKKRDSSSMDN